MGVIPIGRNEVIRSLVKRVNSSAAGVELRVKDAKRGHRLIVSAFPFFADSLAAIGRRYFNNLAILGHGILVASMSSLRVQRCQECLDDYWIGY